MELAMFTKLRTAHLNISDCAMNVNEESSIDGRGRANENNTGG